MSTLEELQGMSDGNFHLLGDDLLRRLEPRYRHLRTHGVNDRGDSIKGQPDSYVGNTANTCTIAVCYTIQRAGWWKKVVEDVRDAVAASSALTEVVVVIPHNADRDGPKDKTIDWFGDAQKAAGRVSLHLFDGRDLSRLLDTEHQDLRHEHLGIPYSRLCGASILTGCRFTSTTAINSIQASGRYDPGRYSSRSADRELYRLWQTTLRNDTGTERRAAPVRLIALVSDSGVGKTSLVCEFARSLGRVLPVLLVQARDLAFGTEDGLVASAVQAIQGFLEPSVRVIEEAALAKHLAGPMPLTIVLDGLDEARNPDAVRRAITFWLGSRLGQSSVLIVTSRREFWRTCSDPSWARWMPKAVSEDREPVKVARHTDVKRNDPMEGVRLPGRFTRDELEVAWARAGHAQQELLALATDAREELLHPFTLRLFLDISTQDGPPRTVTRAALLERWLNRCLDVEAVPSDRISRSHFQQALRTIATKLADSNAGSVWVDELREVPRFDPVHPPGPVVQRLLGANILESLAGQPDHVRFSVEAVQDFFRAEADVEAIRSDPDQVATRFSSRSFTAAYPRLARIGQRLVEEGSREAFVSRLAELDAKMASVVVRAAPERYSAALRERVTSELGREIAARHRVRAALAITLLGELNCLEAARVLSDQLLPPTDPHEYLRYVGATAFIKLGHAPAAPFVYRWERFGLGKGNDSYYYSDLLGTIRSSSAEFRAALAAQVQVPLGSGTGSPEHAKAVIVLAYLGDERLVEHLANRLNDNGLLAYYENHALIALGTGVAGDLFARSVLMIGQQLALLPDQDAHRDARNELIARVHFSAGDVRYLLTPAFESHLLGLIADENLEVSWIASDLAKRGRVTSLLFPVTVAAAKRKGWIEPDWYGLRGCVTPAAWVDWWAQTHDPAIRRKLLGLTPLYPAVEVEEVLLGCLDEPELQGIAARRLGEYGSVRATSRLRHLLAEGSAGEKVAAADALGRLRDEGCVPLLKQFAETESTSWTVDHAVSNLGFIGTSQAELALTELLRGGHGTNFDDTVCEGLLSCGSPTAVGVVLGRARVVANGTAWLCERLDHFTRIRGWSRGKYFTHISTADLVGYLDAHHHPDSADQGWDTAHAFRRIDSPEIRQVLRKWAVRRGTPQDFLVRESDQRRMSDLCYWELRDRGDESAIEYTLDCWADSTDDVYAAITADFLRPFPSALVAERVGARLAIASSTSETVRLLALLGRFGSPSDADRARQFLDHADVLVANVACEATFRLGDPLLVPDGWREV